ncbi:hypothetical protein ACMTN4_01735 (plasmid) [Rhodococcus globerulus]|uniref:hypothetical protein n=1 Tax=Rhodococcus globerulus TaxID=33008 RepID=UPI0039EA9D33
MGLQQRSSAPAITLPLAVDAAGMQFGAGMHCEAGLIGLAGELEMAMPWSARGPRVHASQMEILT